MPRGPRSIVNTLNSVTAMKSVIEGPGAGERAITLAKLSCSGVNAQVAMAVMSKAVTTPTPTALARANLGRRGAGLGRRRVDGQFRRLRAVAHKDGEFLAASARGIVNVANNTRGQHLVQIDKPRLHEGMVAVGAGVATTNFPVSVAEHLNFVLNDLEQTAHDALLAASTYPRMSNVPRREALQK